MSRIYGSIEIDFDVSKEVSEEQFNDFKMALNRAVDEFNDKVFQVASESGFEIDGIHPTMLDTDMLTLVK